VNPPRFMFRVICGVTLKRGLSEYSEFLRSGFLCGSFFISICWKNCIVFDVMAPRERGGGAYLMDGVSWRILLFLFFLHEMILHLLYLLAAVYKVLHSFLLMKQSWAWTERVDA